MSHFKNFIDWFKLKPKLDQSKQRPMFQEREVLVCHLGSNIGFELDGKNTESLRPAIVFKKLSKNTLLIIPLTTQICDLKGNLKNGSWYAPSFVNGIEGRYCLNQVKMIDSKRLKYKLERISEENFSFLKQAFYEMLEN